jgi:hypothetical protein
VLFLGQSSQGIAAVRLLIQDDHLILQILACELPLEPRARILTKERLEAIMLLGDPKVVQH